VDPQIILNVDDYAPGRYARSKILRQAGFGVIEAQTGAEALRLVEEQKPALVLLDVNLPDMNGFEVCRKIRENPEVVSTTVVHISASNVLPQHQAYGLDSGADGYLLEPLEPAVLVATVNAFLRLRRAEDALRRSNRELEEYAFVISHDLQEPLRTISIYTELLANHFRAQEDSESAKYESYVRSGVQRMDKMIRDLLQFSQVIHQGEIGDETTDLNSVLARVLELNRERIEAEHAEITCQRLPVVRGNEPLLEQVFRNLISNALKYRRPEESPHIQITSLVNGYYSTISVVDNGLGFEPQYAERIFGLFKRLHGMDVPGTGIGLAICKRVIEQAGGRIWAQSQPGRGSTFSFTLKNA
jgi:light-regulated signal transduction histidine kinase (bacteriophytochrome)